MTDRRRTLVPGLAALALAAILTGCGVTLQEAAEPLPTNALPAPLRIPTPAPPPSPTATPSGEPSASPSAQVRIWFVQEDGLAAVESTLPTVPTPDLVLQALAIGPTPDEAAQGMRTVARDPLTGRPLVFISAARPSPSAAATVAPSTPASGPPGPTPSSAPVSTTVTLDPAFSALPPSEQVLLLGQVVLSLAGVGEQTVAFVDDAGSPVAVPLPDGRLLDMPATPRDYAGLIVRP